MCNSAESFQFEVVADTLSLAFGTIRNIIFFHLATRIASFDHYTWSLSPVGGSTTAFDVVLVRNANTPVGFGIYIDAQAAPQAAFSQVCVPHQMR